MAIQQRDPERERFWRTAVTEQHVSSLTVRVYRQRYGLAESSFHDWRSEIRRRDVKPKPSATFVPATVVPSATPAISTVEVRCPSGHVVTVPADAATLRLVFTILAEGSPC